MNEIRIDRLRLRLPDMAESDAASLAERIRARLAVATLSASDLEAGGNEVAGGTWDIDGLSRLIVAEILRRIARSR